MQMKKVSGIMESQLKTILYIKLIRAMSVRHTSDDGQCNTNCD